MKILFLSICTLFAVACAVAESPEPFEVKLWPEGPAESNGLSGPEVVDQKGRVSNVSDPTMTVYLPEAEKRTGAAMLICPGGGYSFLAFDNEGTNWGEWFAENGIVGVVLKYRMPNCHHRVPLADAIRAMQLIREHATAWGVDPTKVGVIGFSAGGHLVTTLITHYTKGTRPDFAIAAYPVVSFDKKYLREGAGTYLNLVGGDQASQELRDLYSNEKQVTPQTPPTLILFSDDDKTVKPINGTVFYEALKANGVPASLLIFPSGGHGWGFRENFKYHEPMTAAVLDWIERQTSGE